MKTISLVTFGSLLEAAQFAAPQKSIVSVPGAPGAIGALRSLMDDQGPSYATTARKFDLDGLRSGEVFEGIQELRRALSTDEPLRLNLMSRLQPDAILGRAFAIDAVIRWCETLGPCPTASLLLSGESVLPSTPPALTSRLFRAMFQLQSLQLIAGVAMTCEQGEQFDWAGQFYKWYLICQEQIERGGAKTDPTVMTWGLERLIAVSETQGKNELADRLRRFQTRTSSPQEIDLTKGSPGTDAEVNRRIMAQLAGMGPGETIIVRLSTKRLSDLIGYAERLHALLESSPQASNLVGRRVILRSVEFGMEYRLTVDSRNERPMVNSVFAMSPVSLH